MSDKREQTPEQERAAMREALRATPPDRLQHAPDAVLGATVVDAPPAAAGMPGGAPLDTRGGGKWLHVRVNGPDHTSLNSQAARARAATEAQDRQAMREHAARAQATEEPQADRRMALLEIDK